MESWYFQLSQSSYHVFKCTWKSSKTRNSILYSQNCSMALQNRYLKAQELLFLQFNPIPTTDELEQGSLPRRQGMQEHVHGKTSPYRLNRAWLALENLHESFALKVAGLSCPSLPAMCTNPCSKPLRGLQKYRESSR